MERSFGVFVGAETGTIDGWDVEFDAEVAELGGGDMERNGLEEGVMLLEDGLDDAMGEVGLKESMRNGLREGGWVGTGRFVTIFAVEEEGVHVHEQVGGELCVVLTPVQVKSYGL